MIDVAVQVLLDALLLIGLYAIGSLGFSLVWGVMNVLNLTYAALITFGGYATYVLWRLGLDPLLAIPLAALLTGLLGWIIQYAAIDQVLKGPHSLSITLTYGINLVLTGAILLTFTTDPHSIQLPNYLNGFIAVGGARLTYSRVLVMVLALATTASVWWFMDRTETGAAIRATRLDIEAARLVGIEVIYVYHVTAIVSSVLAGITGGLAALIYSVVPQMGDPLLTQILIVNVLGGLGSMIAPLVGSALLGFCNAIVGNLMGATYSVAIGIMLVLAVLCLRPAGLIGKRFYEH